MQAAVIHQSKALFCLYSVIVVLASSTPMLVRSTPVQRLPVTWPKLAPSAGVEGNAENYDYGRSDIGEQADRLFPQVKVIVIRDLRLVGPQGRIWSDHFSI